MCVFCVVRVSVVYNWFLSLNLFTRLVTDAAKWKVCFFFFFFTFVAIRLQIDIMRTVETNVRMCVYRSVHILMVGWLVEKTCPKNEQSWLCKSHTHTHTSLLHYIWVHFMGCLFVLRSTPGKFASSASVKIDFAIPIDCLNFCCLPNELSCVPFSKCFVPIPNLPPPLGFGCPGLFETFTYESYG